MGGGAGELRGRRGECFPRSDTLPAEVGLGHMATDGASRTVWVAARMHVCWLHLQSHLAWWNGAPGGVFLSRSAFSRSFMSSSTFLDL